MLSVVSAEQAKGEKMKHALLVLILLLCTAMWAEDGVLRFHGKDGAIVGVWGYGEYAYGSINRVNIQGIQYGLAVEILGRIQVKGYESGYNEGKLMFDDSKYNFSGYGVRIGPVIHAIGLDILPSIGWEKGTIEIGEGEYTEGFWGYQYDYIRTEKISYVPISLEVQAKIGRILLLSGRYFFAPHSDYSLNGFCLGLGLGWK